MYDHSSFDVVIMEVTKRKSKFYVFSITYTAKLKIFLCFHKGLQLTEY
jgi:hypothetical protein